MFAFEKPSAQSYSATRMVHITVKQLDGSSFSVNVNGDITVNEFLQLIAAASDESASTLRLVHGGQLLISTMRLSDQAICDSTALMLLKEGGTTIRAPNRPIGVSPSIKLQHSEVPRPVTGEGRPKGTSQIQEAAFGGPRRVPDAINILWVDGSVFPVALSNQLQTVAQLKGAVSSAVGIVIAPSHISLFHSGVVLGDEVLLGVS